MGWKASMIIVQRPAEQLPETALLGHLGFGHYRYVEDTTLEVCMYPEDKSINIGHYNDCLIICEDYQLSGAIESDGSADPAGLMEHERVLTALFPGSEVLTVACHSAVNWHAYALAKDGQRIRFKHISSDTPLVEWGQRLEEEEKIYAHSKMVDGTRMFAGTWSPEVYDNLEDQMMEDFAFGTIERHLGVRVDDGSGDALTYEVPFRKYKRGGKPSAKTAAVKPGAAGSAGTSGKGTLAGSDADTIGEADGDAGPGRSEKGGRERKPWWKIW